MTVLVDIPQQGERYVDPAQHLTTSGLQLFDNMARAIIELQGEAGANANGDYVRANIGGVKLQVCWRKDAASANPTTWTFPAAFAADPTVFATAVTDSVARMVTVAGVTTTAADFYTWTDSGGASTVPHNEFAIGLWE